MSTKDKNIAQEAVGNKENQEATISDAAQEIINQHLAEIEKLKELIEAQTEQNKKLLNELEGTVSENESLKEEVQKLGTQNTSLFDELQSLSAELDTSKEAFDKGLLTVKVSKKTYSITGKRFNYQNKEYTAEDLVKNPKLAAELVELGVGFLNEIKEA